MADLPAVVFFCHGSRDPLWREPFDRIVAQFRAEAPRRGCELAFLELMAPSLPEAIDRLAGAGETAIHVVPLFLAPGAHTRRDLPVLLDQARQRWPRLALTTGPTLAESADMRAAVVAAALRATG